MSQIFIPVLFALLMWWISTGVILRVVMLPPRTYPASVAVAAAITGAALLGLATVPKADASDAYVTFTCVLAVWGFVELTFLTGYVTGPRKTALPIGVTGWRRFRFAIETILFHELLLLAGAAAVLIAAGPDNGIASGTYAVLWVMRLSAKLNLFLGVPSLNADLLPRQLAHLASYFRNRSMNVLLPVSIVGSAVATALLFDRAASGDDYSTAGYALLGALLALALLEHLFMLMPFPVAALWGRRQAPVCANDNDVTVSRHLPPGKTPAPQSPEFRSLGGLQ
jgi:putative photosynthetic complex assembly protein 2